MNDECKKLNEELSHHILVEVSKLLESNIQYSEIEIGDLFNVIVSAHISSIANILLRLSEGDDKLHKETIEFIISFFHKMKDFGPLEIKKETLQ